MVLFGFCPEYLGGGGNIEMVLCHSCECKLSDGDTKQC